VRYDGQVSGLYSRSAITAVNRTSKRVRAATEGYVENFLRIPDTRTEWTYQRGWTNVNDLWGKPGFVVKCREINANFNSVFHNFVGFVNYYQGKGGAGVNNGKTNSYAPVFLARTGTDTGTAMVPPQHRKTTGGGVPTPRGGMTPGGVIMRSQQNMNNNNTSNNTTNSNKFSNTIAGIERGSPRKRSARKGDQTRTKPDDSDPTQASPDKPRYPLSRTSTVTKHTTTKRGRGVHVPGRKPKIDRVDVGMC
jgi:hypothetical protein